MTLPVIDLRVERLAMAPTNCHVCDAVLAFADCEGERVLMPGLARRFGHPEGTRGIVLWIEWECPNDLDHMTGVPEP